MPFDNAGLVVNYGSRQLVVLVDEAADDGTSPLSMDVNGNRRPDGRVPGVPWSLLATPDQFFSQRQERAGTGTSERAGTPNC